MVSLKLNPPKPVQALAEKVSTTKLKLTTKVNKRKAINTKTSKTTTTPAKILKLVFNKPPPKFDWDEISWLTADQDLTNEFPMSPKSTRGFAMSAGSVWEKEGDLLNTPPGSLLIRKFGFNVR